MIRFTDKNKFEEMIDWCDRVLDNNAHVSNVEREYFKDYLKSKIFIPTKKIDSALAILQSPFIWGDDKIAKIKQII